MEEKKSNLGSNVFKIIVIILFITFITLYFSQATGYYEYSQYQKVVFTNEQIKKFEEDVNSGKKVDIENYLDNKTKDYSNNVSSLGYNISSGISKAVKGGLNSVFKYLSKTID